MDGPDYRVKLIELAYNMAASGAVSHEELLRRFRTIYRHMAATVDGTSAELGLGPFGPMGPVQTPDVATVLESTKKELESLDG